MNMNQGPTENDVQVHEIEHSKELPAKNKLQQKIQSGIPIKYVIAIIVITSIVVFLVTYFGTRASMSNSIEVGKEENTAILKETARKLGSDCFTTLNQFTSYLNGNTTLAQNYASGMYSSSTPIVYGPLDRAIQTLGSIPKCQTLIARCTNYQISALTFLNLNPNSCTGCLSTLATCSRCVDKTNSSNFGTNCVGCSISGSVGSCSACQMCSPISLITSCESSMPSFLTSINLAGNSCSGCSGSTCSLCQDKLINGNSGTSCSECSLQSSNTGYCKKCKLCTSKTIQASCQNNAQSYPSLKLLYTSCSDCSGTYCLTCRDLSNNLHIGYNCSQCTLNVVTLNTGYCRRCYFCTPVKVITTCTNANYHYLYLNMSSCQNCSIIGSITRCQICNDKKIPTHNGTRCSSCILTNSTTQTGYCTQCQICHQAKIRSTCLNQPRYSLLLQTNSCTNCITIGTVTTCEICYDRFRDWYVGNMCQNCKITGLGRGYCTQCRICTNSTMDALCANSAYFLPVYINLNSNLPCTGCVVSGDRITCSICPDKTSNGNIGYSCSNCILFTNTTGLCSACAICTPIKITADCPSNSITLNLHELSCQQCYIYGSQTTCRICRDRLNNTNIGTQCTQCTIVTQNKGFCQKCPTCTLDVSLKAYCGNSAAAYNYLNLNNTSCSNCTGSSCGLCVDKINSRLKGYNCNTCIRNAINGTIGYCTGSCSVCVPVRSYTHCGNSAITYSRLILSQVSCSGCVGSQCAICQDATGNGNKGLRCSGCTITQGTRGYCSQSTSCAICTPISTYTNCRNHVQSLNDIIKLNQTSCTGCSVSTGTCTKCSQSTTSTIYGQQCSSCTVISQNNGYCSISSSCSICTPISTYTNCGNYQYSVWTLNLNVTSCSGCYGTTCAKCTDQNYNGYIGYNCQGCTVTDSINGLGYCSKSSTCAICTPVLIISSCGNWQNSHYYLRLDENSCTGCIGGSCNICTDNSGNGNNGVGCQQCQIVSGNSGYCRYCRICS